MHQVLQIEILFLVKVCAHVMYTGTHVALDLEAQELPKYKLPVVTKYSKPCKLKLFSYFSDYKVDINKKVRRYMYM